MGDLVADVYLLAVEMPLNKRDNGCREVNVSFLAIEDTVALGIRPVHEVATGVWILDGEPTMAKPQVADHLGAQIGIVLLGACIAGLDETDFQ
jgi:hypothetical protein